MLDAPGGGGGTPWESMTIEDMQRLIQNPDTDKQWDLVDGWKKSSELLGEHRFQVQDYRDNLAAAWPPERSAASAAYLARLDTLIANLTETYEAALSNYDAISAATGSIYQAQVKMDKIYQEYASNKSLLDDYNAKQQPTGATPTPRPSGEQPPVAPGRQEQLRTQAATMLSTVSSDLAQAQVRIVTPTKYEPAKPVEESKNIGDGTTYVPPPIPPITPAFSNDTTTSGSTRSPASFPTSTASPVIPQSGTQPGLILGGATAPPLPPPTTGINPIAPTLPGGSGPIGSPGLLPPSTFAPGGGPSMLPPTTGVGRGIGLPREGVVRAGGIPDGVRAMPAGGIIGQAPGAGLGQPGAGRTGARRVNPVGGVIGEGHQGSLGARRGVGAGGMVAGEHPGGLYGQGGGRSSGRRDEANGSHWDPDNPWETAEGVDPVVLPVQEQRIDPGPAIGLG